MHDEALLHASQWKAPDLFRRSVWNGFCLPGKSAQRSFPVHFSGFRSRHNDISAAIQKYAESFGFGVVRDLVGHGIGSHLHEDPEIPNFARKRKGILLQPGMTLAIEPMITEGSYEVVWLDDDWTVMTEDGGWAAHYENTILITENEPEILSL